MIRPLFRAALGCALFAGCSASAFSPLPEETIVRWGTSFGECIGYCSQVLVVTSSGSRLIRSGYDAQSYPTITRERELPAGRWDELREYLGRSDIAGLDEVYGCPDCADGGAEWVELETDGSIERVTFEFGHPPTKLQDAVKLLETLRDDFGTP
jgi:hypothetical protein